MTGPRIDPPSDTFGSRVRAARRLKGKNQADIAAAVGISQSCFSRYEHNDVQPTAGMLFAIAAALDVDAYWLWTGLGRPVAA